MANCWSCGKENLDAVANRCYGCHHVVCVNCAMKYGHEFGGEHGVSAQPTNGGLCVHCGVPEWRHKSVVSHLFKSPTPSG